MYERQNDEPKTYHAQGVRQGSVILKKPWQRWLFGIGVVGGVLWALFLAAFFISRA